MQTRDEAIWELARRRASFKKSLAIYVVVCGFFWALWMMSGHRYWYPFQTPFAWHTPWPMWLMFWWGLVIAIKFAKAYLVDTPTTIEQEYEKLKRRQQQS